MAMITKIEDYFDKGCGRCQRFDTLDCSARVWISGLEQLRAICLEAGLEESLKWGHPCYVHAGRNIAIISAFRSDFRLSFFHAALLKDADGLLEKQGPNTPHPDMLRFTDSSDVQAKRRLILTYLAEAMAYAAQGIEAPKDQSERDLPDELAEALDADPILAEAFAALTRGRKNSYIVNLTSAKQKATRIKRIAKFRDKILAGKGATER